MQTLNLDSAMIMKITAEPSLYRSVSFLERMKNPALSTHLKLNKMNCTGCAKKAKYVVAMQLAAAFLQLVNQELKKNPNEIYKLKQSMATILGQEFNEVRATLRLANGQLLELKF